MTDLCQYHCSSCSQKDNRRDDTIRHQAVSLKELGDPRRRKLRHLGGILRYIILYLWQNWGEALADLFEVFCRDSVEWQALGSKIMYEFCGGNAE